MESIRRVRVKRPTENPGRLIWSGEHWINGIRTQDSQEPSGWFSLYHTRYSEFGEGNTLQLVVPSLDIQLVCTDNLELGKWINEKFFRNSWVDTSHLPLVEGTFFRKGEVRKSPSYVVFSGKIEVVSSWEVKDPPVITYGPFSEDKEFFTLLFFTEESSLELNGQLVSGTPYRRDIWRDSIGGERSSSVIALAETMIRSD